MHHLRRAVEVIAEGLDFHMEHMHEVFPELVLDLLCYGPIEKGLDASHGGVEFYNLCVDGAALATVADSLRGARAARGAGRAAHVAGSRRSSAERLGGAGGRTRPADDAQRPALRQRRVARR